MPVPASAGEIYEVVTHQRQEGQMVLNVNYYRCVTAVDDLEVRLLRALIVCLLTLLRPTQGSNWQFVKMSCKRVSPDLGPIFELLPEVADEVQGESEGDTLPTHNSVCVNIHTTRGGRSGRGRMFLAGVPEGATSGSYIEESNPHWEAIVAYLACVAGHFVKPTVTTGVNVIQLGVVSRKIALQGLPPDTKQPPYPPASFAAATKLVPRNIVGTTNSRKVGRGA